MHRGLALAVVAGMLLTGCAGYVDGAVAPGPGVPSDVSQAELPIDGAVPGNPADDTARNTLADLADYWRTTFPATFGHPFLPLQGSINSVDPAAYDPADHPAGITCGLEVDQVADNAYYCGQAEYPNSDGVTYDRTFMAELARQYGRYLPSLVMAHEFGHAVQARYDGAPRESINVETQADCFAGAFSRWVADGHAAHSSLLAPELDRALQGFLLIRDPVGTSPDEQGAHGSFFDRVSGFQEGYDGGAAACRDEFHDGERLFTQQDFTTDADLGDNGNLPYAAALTFTTSSLERFWTAVFPAVFGTDFTVPAVSPFAGTPPACTGLGRHRDLGFCAEDDTVYFDERDLTRPVAQQIGDFAVTTAISLPYAEAARSQLDLTDVDRAERTRSDVCLTGWFAAQLSAGEVGDLDLSPGDLDEAIAFLLDHGGDPAVFPDNPLTGFELTDSFRTGFFSGVGACDVGV